MINHIPIFKIITVLYYVYQIKSMNLNINWNETIHKETKGIDDTYFGEVKDVLCGYVITQRKNSIKEKFCIPQYKVKSYDGNVLRFDVSAPEADSKYNVQSPSLN